MEVVQKNRESALEEKRLRTRIYLQKYNSVAIDADTKKSIRTGEVCVRINGKLMPFEEARYLEKELYKDYQVPESVERHGAYVDRMYQWDDKKFTECNAKLKGNRICNGGTIQGCTVGSIEKFLSLYNGYPCRLTLIKESTGYNGYNYTYLQWVKVSDI